MECAVYLFGDRNEPFLTFFMLQRWFLFCTKSQFLKNSPFDIFFSRFFSIFHFIYFLEYCVYIHHLSRVHMFIYIYIQKNFILQDPSFLALMYTFFLPWVASFISLFYDKNDFGIVTCCCLPIVYEPADYICVYNSCWRAPLKSSERKRMKEREREQEGPVVEQNKYTFFPLHSLAICQMIKIMCSKNIFKLFSVFLMNFSKHMPWS